MSHQFGLAGPRIRFGGRLRPRRRYLDTSSMPAWSALPFGQRLELPPMLQCPYSLIRLCEAIICVLVLQCLYCMTVFMCSVCRDCLATLKRRACKVSIDNGAATHVRRIPSHISRSRYPLPKTHKSDIQRYCISTWQVIVIIIVVELARDREDINRFLYVTFVSHLGDIAQLAEAVSET